MFQGLVLIGAAWHFVFIYRYGTRSRSFLSSALSFPEPIPRVTYHAEPIYRAG